MVHVLECQHFRCDVHLLVQVGPAGCSCSLCGTRRHGELHCVVLADSACGCHALLGTCSGGCPVGDPALVNSCLS
jgi:hypothetical protein